VLYFTYGRHHSRVQRGLSAGSNLTTEATEKH
jgi:hypothetical protein